MRDPGRGPRVSPRIVMNINSGNRQAREWEEFNPWQVPMGSMVEPVLKLCEADVYRVQTSRRGCQRRRARALQQAFGDEGIAAVILSQQLIGKKVWTK